MKTVQTYAGHTGEVKNVIPLTNVRASPVALLSTPPPLT